MSEIRKLAFQNLNQEAFRVHEANAKWWIDIHTGKRLDRNVLEMGMLACSELAEALEGHRKNRMDDHLPQYPMPIVEIADCVIRVFDTVHGLKHEFSNREYANWCSCRNWAATPDNFGERLFCINREVVRLYDYLDYYNKLRKGVWPPQTDPMSVEERAAVVIGMSELLAYVTYPEIPFREVYEAKMAYNAVRADHTLEHRRTAEGKKY
jgi:hypothetical protein